MGSLRIRRRAAVIALFLFAFLAGTAPAATEARTDGPAAAEPKTLLSSAPDFTGIGVDGRSYRLTDLLKHGPVLIDFWTTCCKPCLLAMPKLQEVWQRHQSRGFTLLGIPSDDQRTTAKVKPKIQQMGFVFPNIPDPTRRIGNAYNIRNFPTAVLIAPDGKIVKVTQGFSPGDEKGWEREIVALLGPGGGAPEEGK